MHDIKVSRICSELFSLFYTFYADELSIVWNVMVGFVIAFALSVVMVFFFAINASVAEPELEPEPVEQQLFGRAGAGAKVFFGPASEPGM
jgi:hypothetical protein